MKLRRRLYICWALLLALVASAPAREADRIFAAEIQAFKKLDQLHAPEPGRVLFLGSSSFTKWTRMQAAFPNHPLINRAFGGSTLLDEAYYINDLVSPYAPKEIVFYCGENDFAADPKLSPDVVVGRFEALFVLIRRLSGPIKFVYVSMKPSPSRWNLAPKFRAANGGIKAFLSSMPATTFVDVWPVMLRKGKPDPDIFGPDKLHMNEIGYRRWAQLIEKHLL